MAELQGFIKDGYTGDDGSISLPEGANTGAKTNDTEKLPDEMAAKFYQAFGRFPKADDLENYKLYPNAFIGNINGTIEKNQADMTAEEKKVAKEESIAKWEAETATAANKQYQFDGDFALIKFQNDPTPDDGIDNTDDIWLFDQRNNTYRPFASIDSMKSVFGDKYEEAMGRVVSLPTTALQSEFFKPTEFFPRKYAVQDDGSMPKVPGFESNNIETSVYGKERKNPQTEIKVGNYLGSIFTTMKREGGISDETFKKYMEDPEVLSKYISAVLYGEYSFAAIYRDIKAKELSDQGNSEYDNYKGFDENTDANKWYKTDEGLAALDIDGAITAPETFGMSPELFKNSIFQIPPDAFSTIVVPIDKDSEEFKAEAEAIQASYYDIMMEKAEAQTEQAKAVADNNWETFKSDMQKKYGIQLSNNAEQAWGQLQTIGDSYSGAGLNQSGLEQEAIDKRLADTRKSDSLIRESEMSDKDRNLRNYLLQSGSVEEIQDFKEKNPALAESWGLVPSSDVIDFWSKESLKERYPNMKDEQIQEIHDTMIDTNGNYRSQLFSNLFNNKYELGQQKKTYQEDKLYQQKKDDEEKAYAPYTTESPFVDQANYTGQTGAYTPQTSQKDVINSIMGNKEKSDSGSAGDAAGDIAAKIGGSEDVTNKLTGDNSWSSFKADNPNKDFSSHTAIPWSGDSNSNYNKDDWKDVQEAGGTLYGIKR